jgi:DNA-binding NarL/FixJ family response regulator
MYAARDCGTLLLGFRGRPAMKILVIDDHALIREGMHGVIRKLKRGAVPLYASDYGQAMQAVANHPDIALILLDLKLPDRDGFEVLAELRESHPSMAVVVLSAEKNPASVFKALDLGAVGYIPKSAHHDVMLSALQLVLKGGIYVPPEILAHEPGEGSATRTLGGDRTQSSPKDLGLSDSHLEILALMMLGKSNKVICRTLGLAESTVKNRVSAILKALEVTNRTEAVVAANRLRWTPPATAKS